MREGLVTILEHRDEAQGNNSQDGRQSKFYVRKYKIPRATELNFLKTRDIQIAVDGKKKKRAELLELCKSAGEMTLFRRTLFFNFQSGYIFNKLFHF